MATNDTINRRFCAPNLQKSGTSLTQDPRLSIHLRNPIPSVLQLQRHILNPSLKPVGIILPNGLGEEGHIVDLAKRQTGGSGQFQLDFDALIDHTFRQGSSDGGGFFLSGF